MQTNQMDSMDFLPAFEKRESRLLRVVFHCDLRNNHDGLTHIAKGLGVNTNTLQPGEFVAFINTKKNAIKLFAAGQVVAHFRMPSHRKMDLRVLKLIPRFFNGRELKYDDALGEIIRSEWGGRK